MKKLKIGLLFLLVSTAALGLGQSTTQIIADRIISGSGTTTVTGAFAVNTAASIQEILQPVGTFAVGLELKNKTSSGHKNWLFAVQNNVNGMEFTPSTANDGSTFSTPAFSVTEAGVGTLLQSLNVGNSSTNGSVNVVGTSSLAPTFGIDNTNAASGDKWSLSVGATGTSKTFTIHDDSASAYRLKIDGSGNIALPAYGAGVVQSDASGNLTSGTISVASGGTGAATLTSHGVLLGQGTSSVTALSPNAAGKFLISNGTGGDPIFSATPTVGANASIPGAIYFANSNTSGQSVAVQNTSCTSTYNFNLPAASGNSGDILTSGGGVSSPMTWTSTTGSGNIVLATSATLVTPALGTPSALVGTNISGTGASFTAGNVSTNHNMTGPITGTGNVTSITAQTGTGTTFVMSAAPTFSGITSFPGSTTIDASGNVGVGLTNPASQNEWAQSPIFAVSSSTYGSAVLTSTVADGNGNRIGALSFEDQTNTATFRSRAVIETVTDGSTANKRGGKLVFRTAADNTTSPAIEMSIDNAGTVLMTSLAGTGSRAVNASATGVLSAASDESLKVEEKKAAIPGLSEIMKLKPRAYRWKEDIKNRGKNAAVEIGFFANEVAPIIPSAAPKDLKGLYGFYDRSVIAALVKAVQEQQTEIEELKMRAH